MAVQRRLGSLGNICDEEDDELGMRIDIMDSIKRKRIEEALEEPIGRGKKVSVIDKNIYSRIARKKRIERFPIKCGVNESKKTKIGEDVRKFDKDRSTGLFRRPKILGMKRFFSLWKEKERKERIEYRKKQYVIEKWRAYVLGSKRVVFTDGLEKFNGAIHALSRLDDLGYRRSKQQIEFHTHFLGSMVQQIFGTDLNKYLHDILEALGLNELSRDIAVCCPRRFGKTTSVALFATTMVYTQGDIDFVIYSIAMRTSRMLTARIYQMIVGLAGGAHVITTSNQEILTVSSISGGSSTVYSYPAASAISNPFPHIHTYIGKWMDGWWLRTTLRKNGLIMIKSLCRVFSGKLFLFFFFQ